MQYVQIKYIAVYLYSTGWWMVAALPATAITVPNICREVAVCCKYLIMPTWLGGSIYYRSRVSSSS